MQQRSIVCTASCRPQVRAMVKERRQPQLRSWMHGVIAAGGLLTYYVAGLLLLGAGFIADLQSLLADPAAIAGADAEQMAPYVLLVIPAVLGAITTRALLRIVIGGLARGEPLGMIAKAVGVFLASLVVLVVVAFLSDAQKRP